VRTSPRSISGSREFSNPPVIEFVPIKVEESGGSTFAATTKDISISLRVTASWKQKPGSRISIRVFKCYPADAVQADHPFPSVTGG
jgi:hypothetical protein